MVFCCICLNLIGIGSQQTIIAIFNITAPALDLSYVAVIFARMVYSKEVKFIDGPFTLGRWGRPLNCVAICWVLFISVILFFPPIKPITLVNMYVAHPPPSLSPSCLCVSWLTWNSLRNYAICIAAFIALFALSWWWAGARKFVTPLILVHLNNILIYIPTVPTLVRGQKT